MPIFYQQDVSEQTRLAVWKIEENEEFFLQRVPLQKEIRHPHKRLQHLAGRYLLQHLFPDFPLSLILIADTRKPYLEHDTYHFSISHCDDYAAVIASKVQRVGVDIETVTEKINRISKKFIGPEEEHLMKHAISSGVVRDHTSLATIIWSAKEAVFKWYGLGEMDFRAHMQVQKFTALRDDNYALLMEFKKQQPPKVLSLHSTGFSNLTLCYIATG